MSIKQRQQILLEEFSSIDNWEDRYKLIIQKGKDLKALPDKYKTDDNKVKGCQSQVWIHANIDPETKKIILQADSDAMIVKGLVAVLLQVYSDSSADEILNTPVDFLKDLGLQQHLSPSRANGLYSMLKQIIFYATAFKIKSEN